MDSKHHSPSLLLLLVFLLIPLTLSEGETKVWINQVDGYSKLVPCAQDPLSTIVRGMASGCGDDNSYTSYTCFCTGSSSKMATIISKAVSTTCRNSSAPQQISSALDVFDQYCAIGVAAGTTIAPLHSASATATPAASSALATQTAGAADASSSSSTSRTTAIAAGVAVPVATIALAVGAFFLYRARRQKAEHAEGGEKTVCEADAAAVDGGAVGELPPDQRFEAPSGEPALRHELDSDPKGSGVVEKDGEPVVLCGLFVPA
ncbi:hypothetical protein GTA08_BOTSDO09024 [Neofusicoccum parvum]|nr:hypothetical protein GTA08_BOTSDO09024 [Neofusicoccum parvum]